MDRRKGHPRLPLWTRSSSEDRTGGSTYHRKPSYWPTPPQERSHKSSRPQKKKRGKKKKRSHGQRSRPPRYEVVATERITLRNRVHVADWDKRAQIIEDHAELVEKAQETGEAPWPPQVWKIGEEYVLARGFAALAAATDADLAEIEVVVAARFPRWELTWVSPDKVEGTDPLLSKALHAQEKVQQLGWVFPPLVVTSKGDNSFVVGRGKRAAARLWAAQEEGLSTVPVVIRPRARQPSVVGTVHIDIDRIRITSPRHLRKMHKPLPSRLLSEVANGNVQPIRVRRTPDGEYELVDGLLRLRASKEIGLRSIYAVVEIDPSRRRKK